MPVLFVALIVAVVVLACGLDYNRLVRSRVRIGEAWAQIDVELKRRHDLIPRLVDTVKGYAVHERATFEAVATARATAISAQASHDPTAVGGAEGDLGHALGSLLALTEGYPVLRAADSFLQLQERLTACEDKLEYARHFYNGSVRDYNTAIQSFPRNLMAATMGFRPAAFLDIEVAERTPPSVDLSGDAGTLPDGAQMTSDPRSGKED